MAAVLAGWGGYYRQRVYLNEARRLGLTVRPPHINHGQRNFSVSYPKGVPTLYMGLDQIRDLTRQTQRRIQKERPFHTVEDFLMRVDPRPQEAENLAKVGALNGFGKIPDLLNRILKGGWAFAQPPLFQMDYRTEDSDWDLFQQVEAQLEILGASLAAHPVELAAGRIAELGAVTTLEALTQLDENLRVVGVKQTVQRFFSYKGEPFHILELEDMEGVLPVMMDTVFYQQHRRWLSSSTPFMVEGMLVSSPTTGEPVLRAKSILPLR
jgi:DNA polymerase III alpha subunit